MPTNGANLGLNSDSMLMLTALDWMLGEKLG
jgi:hypothetical protein